MRTQIRSSSHEPPTTDPSPFEFAKLLEGRIALEFPTSVLKEENVSESYDRNTARYLVVWYNQDETGKKIDLAERVRVLSGEVLDLDAEAWFSVSYSETTRSKTTSQIMVTYNRKDRPSLTTKASADEPDLAEIPISTPVSVLVGEKCYRIISTDVGTTWEVVDDQDIVVEQDLPSVSAALARALKYVFVELSYAEEISGGKSTTKALGDMDRNFLAGWASWFVNSPVVNKEAKKHLVSFVELVTKHDFTGERED